MTDINQPQSEPVEKYSSDYIKGFIDALELVVRQFRMIQLFDDGRMPDGVNALVDKKKIDKIKEIETNPIEDLINKDYGTHKGRNM